MKQLTLSILCLFFVTTAFAQQTKEREAVKAVIDGMFDAMRASDSAALRELLDPDVRLQRSIINAAGQPTVTMGDIEAFLRSVGTPRDQKLDERIWSYDINMDQGLATAWTEYTFYVGDQLSHCGYNAFTLGKTGKEWKIVHIIDTYSKEGCTTKAVDLEAQLNELVDDWHQAASDADADAFFGAMAEDGIYIGTAASERWLRDELRSWAKSAFEKETAWAFKAKERHLTISPDQEYAWWDELLDTWMGDCRATGILENGPEEWKIKHYQLSVTVPNDKIKSFIELVNNP